MLYNSNLRKKITDLSRRDPYYAIKFFKDYFKNYPNDILAYLYYTDILLFLGKFDEVKIILDSVNEPLKYRRNMERVTICNIDINIRYLIMTGNYEKAKQLYDDNYIDGKLRNSNNGSYLDFNLLDLYCDKMQGKEIKPDTNDKRYIYEQMINYDYDKFINHVTKRHITKNEHRIQSLFNDDFPMEQIIQTFQKENFENIKLYNKFYDNLYFFKYDYNGITVRTGYTDYFVVSTFMGTKDIITMYPSEYGEFLPYVDLNYLNEREPKIRKISRVDKFNNRYKDFLNK